MNEDKSWFRKFVEFFGGGTGDADELSLDERLHLEAVGELQRTGHAFHSDTERVYAIADQFHTAREWLEWQDGAGIYTAPMATLSGETRYSDTFMLLAKTICWTLVFTERPPLPAKTEFYEHLFLGSVEMDMELDWTNRQPPYDRLSAPRLEALNFPDQAFELALADLRRIDVFEVVRSEAQKLSVLRNSGTNPPDACERLAALLLVVADWMGRANGSMRDVELHIVKRFEEAFSDLSSPGFTAPEGPPPLPPPLPTVDVAPRS